MARFDQPVLKTDYRLPHYRRRLVPRLAYHFDLATLAENAYFNPAHAPPGAHAGTVRAAFVQFGDGELFADDVRALAEGMRRDGVDVRVDEVPGGIHADATIRRLLSGEKAQSWQHMLGAVREMGWTAHEM
jgi:acetyl esterase/lipase